MVSRTCIRVLVLSLSLATPLLAGSLQKTEVDPEANWLLHANYEAFRDSTLGKLVRAELKAQGIEEQLEDFATVFGFNPLEDLRDVTLYGNGKDREKAVVLIDGRFDQDKLLAMVRMNPEHEEIPHGNVTLHRWQHEENKGKKKKTQIMYGGIYDGRLVVISSGLEAVKGAVDVLAGSGGSGNLGNTLPSGNDNAFLRISAAGVGKMVDQEPQAAVLRQTDSLALTVGETAGTISAQLSLTGTSEEVAQSMTKMLEGIIALATLAAEEQPALAELAKGVKLSQQGRTTQVRFETELRTLFNFLKAQWQQSRQQKEQTP